jgi:hypothetical protein
MAASIGMEKNSRPEFFWIAKDCLDTSHKFISKPTRTSQAPRASAYYIVRV